MFSGGAATFDRLDCGLRYRSQRSRVGGLKAAQNFIGCILQPCIRLVQLPSCLAGQLTKLVAIGHMRECPKYQIRTHKSISFFKCLPGRTCISRRCSLGAKSGPGCPDPNPQFLDARTARPVQNLDAHSHAMEEASCPVRTANCRLGNPFARIPNPGGHEKRTEASEGEPQLNMMREYTDGLCKIAHCSLP